MAVTGRRAAGIALVAVSLAQVRADQASEARSQLQAIAAGLTGGDAAAAMMPFDGSCANYEKLSNYFDGLTSAFQVANEIDVVDEQDAAAETKLTVNWTITLIDLGTDYSERRRSDINVRLVLKGRKWKIVDFAPIEIFDPAQKPASKPTESRRDR